MSFDAVSPSALSSWLRCGEQFRRAYIERERIPPGISARRSSALHKAADTNHKQKITTRVDLPLEALQEAARDEWTRELKEEGVFIPKEDLPRKDALLKQGFNEAQAGVKLYHKAVAPSFQPIETELYLKDDFGFPLPLSSKLDIIDERIFIHDLKLQKRKNQAWADREVQPTFYHLLGGRKYNRWPGRFIYDQLVVNKNIEYDPLITTRDARDVQRLFFFLEQFFKDYEAGSFKPADPTNWLCNPAYCGFYSTCRFGNGL